MARVLVIDDSLFVRAQLRTALEEAGHEVVGEGEDGDAAVRLVKELDPDLVTLDIIMPGRDGLAALRHMMLRDSSTRVLMCSASRTEHHVEKSLALGARGFVSKPVQPQHLLQAVEHALVA
jgi:two-component system chemotaxis response regulator CheY